MYFGTKLSQSTRTTSMMMGLWLALFCALPVLLLRTHKDSAVAVVSANKSVFTEPFLSFPSQKTSLLRKVVVVTDWGAVGDGIHDDTEAMRQLLDRECHCHKHIIIPPNATVTTFPLNLTSHTTLQVDGALIAIQSEHHWPILPPVVTTGTSEDRGPRGWLTNRYQSFLYARNATDIRITGKGTIDGGGPYWWNLSKAKQLTRAGRPNLIQMLHCSNVELDSVTLKDSPFWTVHPILSNDLHIHHLKIRAPLYSPNVDGIDPDSCQNVMIEYNDVSCGDDHIAIKAGVCGLPQQHYVNDCRDPVWRTDAFATRNVTVRHNLFRTGMGIAIGSETSGGIHTVHIYNNTVGLCQKGDDGEGYCGWGPALHIKTTVTRSGSIDNITFEDNIVYNTSMFILLETNYQVDKQDLPPGYPKTRVDGIVFRNNQALGEATSAVFHCDAIDACHNIAVINNSIRKGGDGKQSSSPWKCRFIESYRVAGNFPGGLENCMAQSMNNDTFDVYKAETDQSAVLQYHLSDVQ